jgi:hypothetical protein
LAHQITSSLIHLQEDVLGYYPDLKPDNIILSSCGEGRVRAVLIDFEQRGGWFSWSPPEIYYLEYVEYLATSTVVPEELAAQYGALLRKYEPEWKPPNESDSYQSRAQGFSTAWVSLKPEEREAAASFYARKASLVYL